MRKGVNIFLERGMLRFTVACAGNRMNRKEKKGRKVEKKEVKHDTIRENTRLDSVGIFRSVNVW